MVMAKKRNTSMVFSPKAHKADAIEVSEKRSHEIIFGRST